VRGHGAVNVNTAVDRDRHCRLVVLVRSCFRDFAFLKEFIYVTFETQYYISYLKHYLQHLFM
jgi:hypothetical protein